MQDNNLALWGSGDEAPSCWRIPTIFQKKVAILTQLDDVLHVFRAIRKSLITKIGALSNSCNFAEKNSHLDDVLNVFREIRKT